MGIEAAMTMDKGPEAVCGSWALANRGRWFGGSLRFRL